MVDLLGDSNTKVRKELCEAFLRIIPNLHFDKFMSQSSKETFQNEAFINSSLPSLNHEHQSSQELLFQQNLSHVIGLLLQALHSSFPQSKLCSLSTFQILAELSSQLSAHVHRDLRLEDLYPGGCAPLFFHETPSSFPFPFPKQKLTRHPLSSFVPDLVPLSLLQLANPSIALDLQAHTNILRILGSLVSENCGACASSLPLIFAHSLQLLKILKVVVQKMTPAVILRGSKDPSEPFPDFRNCMAQAALDFFSIFPRASKPSQPKAQAQAQSRSSQVPLLGSLVLNQADRRLGAPSDPFQEEMHPRQQAEAKPGSRHYPQDGSFEDEEGEDEEEELRNGLGEEVSPEDLLLHGFGGQETLFSMGPSPSATESNNTLFIRVARVICNTFKTWGISSIPKHPHQDPFLSFLEATVLCLRASIKGYVSLQDRNPPPMGMPVGVFEDQISCLDAVFRLVPRACIACTQALITLVHPSSHNPEKRGERKASDASRTRSASAASSSHSFRSDKSGRREEVESLPHIHEQLFIRPRTRFSNSLLVPASFYSKMMSNNRRESISTTFSSAEAKSKGKICFASLLFVPPPSPPPS